jgi:hypothetical protein
LVEKDNNRMALIDRYYDKKRSQTTNLAKFDRLKMTNVDLKWPNDGKGSEVKTQDNLTKSIGVEVRLTSRRSNTFQRLELTGTRETR